jgi:hypothetical protein
VEFDATATLSTAGPGQPEGQPDGQPDGRFGGRLGGREARYGEVPTELAASVADVEAWLGTELTAYLTGADSPAGLSGWLSGPAELTEPARVAAGHRLQTARRVVEAFVDRGQGTGARAWLREVSAMTSGRSPAQLIRYARTDHLLNQVRDAAVRYARRLSPGPDILGVPET